MGLIEQNQKSLLDLLYESTLVGLMTKTYPGSKTIGSNGKRFCHFVAIQEPY